MKLLEDIKADPAGAGLAILLPVLFAAIMMVSVRYLEVTREQRLAWPVAVPETPPPMWRAMAASRDVLRLVSRPIEYWGKPSAQYAEKATRKKTVYRAIVVHFTAPKPAVRLVKYQHNGDRKRGGSFGYHFYVNRSGDILQGAPLTKRTNHVKRAGHKRRRKGRHGYVSSSNSIGVAMVGGCEPILPGRKCLTERITHKQRTSALEVIKELRDRYSIPCTEVFGHGELQTDRLAFEGLTIATLVRSICPSIIAQSK